MHEIGLSDNSTYYRDNTLYCIRGFVVKKDNTNIKCVRCTKVLLNCPQSTIEPVHSTFTAMVSRGRLTNVSIDVFNLVK